MTEVDQDETDSSGSLPGISCPTCGEVWPTPQDLSSHRAEQHPAEPTYVEMLDEYLAEQDKWIGMVHKPLVFHLRRLCRQLDQNANAPAAVSSAYLQAFTRLEKMRPGSTLKGQPDDPAQTDIFDHLEE